MSKIRACPSHTSDAFDVETMPKIVDWAAQLCRELQVDAIVACGHSGLVVAGAVAYVTRIPVFAVRKEHEPTVAAFSGSVSAIAPNGPARRWIWLDDFISSGGTYRWCVKQLWHKELIERPFPAAFLEYRSSHEDPLSRGAWYAPDSSYIDALHEFPQFDWRNVERVRRYGFQGRDA